MAASGLHGAGLVALVAALLALVPSPERWPDRRGCLPDTEASRYELRYFSPEARQQAAAAELYEGVRDLPLLCPHGHVDAAIFTDPHYRFPNPTQLLITPDHYVLRMFHSQGIDLAKLGVRRVGAQAAAEAAAETKAEAEARDRAAWRLFCEHFGLFMGTPTGLWVRGVLRDMFGYEGPELQALDGAAADALYDELAAQLASPQFSPRALLRRMRVVVLATTDAATAPLSHHLQLQLEHAAEGDEEERLPRVIPTFRPDALLAVEQGEAWRARVRELGELAFGAGSEPIASLDRFLEALRLRRLQFKAAGAVATDHGTGAAEGAFTTELEAAAAAALFQRAMAAAAGEGGAPPLAPAEARQFRGHMLLQMARMSCEDGLVMQLHLGVFRDHSAALQAEYGPDKGGDIPVAAELTSALRPLLQRYGAHPRLRLVVFTLDEALYARELAPLAGVYPALQVGAPWWFHDSRNGMRRYLDQVTETAGLFNLAGFNDDARALPSIAVRHQLWRRAACDWAAGLVLAQVLTPDEAREAVYQLAVGRAAEVYGLPVPARPPSR